MHMDAARFSPGRWVIVLTRLRAAAHGALLRQHGLRAELAWVWGQRWRGFVAALCCDPGPLRASMRICRPLALNLQARATRSGIEALCPVRGRVASPTTCEAASLRLFLRPQRWVACLMFLAHGLAVRVTSGGHMRMG